MDAAKDQRKGLFEQASVDIEIDPLADQNDESPGGITQGSIQETYDRTVDWERQIELLNLAHKQISVIKHLDQFVNLRKLNLMDSSIEKIQGLENCKLLEELSLEKNKIRIIENLGHLKYLKKLDLG